MADQPEGSVDHPVNLNNHLFGPILKEVHWGGPVALVLIHQSEVSNWNIQSQDPVRAYSWSNASGAIVSFDNPIDPPYTDGHTEYNTPTSGLIDKSSYRKDPSATPFNSGTCLYSIGGILVGTPRHEGGSGGDPDMDGPQYAWLDVGLYEDGFIVGNTVTENGYNDRVHFFDESPYNGEPPSDDPNWHTRFPHFEWTGESRKLDSGLCLSEDGTTMGRTQVGQSRFKVFDNTDKIGGPQKRDDYYIVNFGGSLEADGKTVVPEKIVRLVMPKPIFDPSTPPGRIVYSVIKSNWITPGSVFDSFGNFAPINPLPYPNGTHIGDDGTPRSQYISTTDIQEYLSFQPPPFAFDETASVQISIYPASARFKVNDDGSATVVQDPDAPPDSPPLTFTFQGSRDLDYPSIGGTEGDPPADSGVKFNSKGFIA